MTDIEQQLRAVLVQRAGQVTVELNDQRKTVRSLKVRRLLQGTIAAGLCVAVVSVAIPFTRTLIQEPDSVVVMESTDGPYGFAWREGEGSTIASGSFRDLDWSLQVENHSHGYEDGPDEEDRAHDGSLWPWITLSFGADEPGAWMPPKFYSAESIESSSWSLKDDSASYAFGLAKEDITSVTVVTEDGEEFPAPLFDGPGTAAGDAIYFLAFYPSYGIATLVGHDAQGNELVRDTLTAPVQNCQYPAKRPPYEEGVPGRDPGVLSYDFSGSAGEGSTIATGSFRDSDWSLEIDNPQIEEDEGEGPGPWLLLLFGPRTEIGGETRLGPLEGKLIHSSNGSYVTPDVTFDGPHPAPANFAYGFVSEEVASVALVTGDGQEFGARLFDGPEAPLLGVDYFIVFYPDSRADEMTRIVGRDNDGNKLVEEPLGPMELLSFACPLEDEEATE